MDSISILPGLKKYSSDNWTARLFVVKPGYAMTRDMAPELSHAGLFSARTDHLSALQPYPRNMPLFGEVHPFDDTRRNGGVFLTPSRDDYSFEEMALLSDLVSGSSTWMHLKQRSVHLREMERHFRSLIRFWREQHEMSPIAVAAHVKMSRPGSGALKTF
jgi:hypothetical protein